MIVIFLGQCGKWDIHPWFLMKSILQKCPHSFVRSCSWTYLWMYGNATGLLRKIIRWWFLKHTQPPKTIFREISITRSVRREYTKVPNQLVNSYFSYFLFGYFQFLIRQIQPVRATNGKFLDASVQYVVYTETLVLFTCASKSASTVTAQL